MKLRMKDEILNFSTFEKQSASNIALEKTLFFFPPTGRDFPQIPSKNFPPPRGGIFPRSLPKNSPLWAGNWMRTCRKHLSNCFPPAAGWKHKTILEMYINWNGLPRPLLGTQNFFRLRWAKSITLSRNVCQLEWPTATTIRASNFFPPAARWKHTTLSRNVCELELLPRHLQRTFFIKKNFTPFKKI